MGNWVAETPFRESLENPAPLCKADLTLKGLTLKSSPDSQVLQPPPQVTATYYLMQQS